MTAAELVPDMTAPALPRTVSWRSAVLVALGTTMLVVVSLGPMAAELGTASVVVWLVAAAVGAIQCLLIAELACLFPGRAGGTALYAHLALRHISPSLGAVSSWGYWLAWTPGIAVNLILAAGYLRATVWPTGSTVVIGLGLATGLYLINAMGLRLTMQMAAVLALLAVVPLLAIVVGLVTHPSLLRVDQLLPLAVPGRGWGSGQTWLLMVKWTFVAAWSAYGAEMASTVVAEMRHATSGIWRAMVVSAVVGLAFFGLLPMVLFAGLGTEGLTGEPQVAFLSASRLVFGSAGGTVVTLMLVAALFLGAEAFAVGSSRTIYQMARDGHLPERFAVVNRSGVPIGSIVLDATVIAFFLLAFGERVIDIVAAANVAYLAVFVLLPVAYLSMRNRSSSPGWPRLPRVFTGAAIFLAAFNAVVLTLGALQWGLRVVTVGGCGLLLMVATSEACRRRREAVPVVKPDLACSSRGRAAFPTEPCAAQRARRDKSLQGLPEGWG